MNAPHRELQQLKGVGDILSKRFVEEGLDSCAKIVEAGVDGLKRIKGLNPRILNSLLEQAAQIASASTTDKETRAGELKQGIAGLRDRVQGIVSLSRERFPEELAGRSGKKLTRDLVRILDALDRIEKKLPKRMKRAAKGVLKAEKRLAVAADSTLPKLTKGLKKTRKSLQRVLA